LTTAWATIYIVPIKPRKGLQMTQQPLFDTFIADAGLAPYTDNHHDNLLGGPNSDPVPAHDGMDAYIHHIDNGTRLVITTARGIVTVMVYQRIDTPVTLVLDAKNIPSRDYISQMHVITTPYQCAVAVDAVKPILNL
jgi:hypothetical protein